MYYTDSLAATYLVNESDKVDKEMHVPLELENDFFAELDSNKACTHKGCQATTSDAERLALEEFYDELGGNFWRYNYNWNSGDPCDNHWFGVGCDSDGHVISLHFFENHVVGNQIPDEIANI